MTSSSAPCGGDAYRPWGEGVPKDAPGQGYCDTCAHATREAAERSMSERIGIDVTGTMPPPFGKCLGVAGLGVVR